MTLQDILATLRADGDAATVQIPDSWLQGRSAYGGLQAGLVVHAMRRQVPADVPLRTLQTTFIAPVASGLARIETRVLREGKSTAHVEGRLYTGDQLACLCIAVFGRGRESKIHIPLPVEPAPKTADEAYRFPFVPKFMPDFLQNLEVRWATNNVPFSGADEPHVQLHVRLDAPPPAGAISNEVLLVTLADAPPSPATVKFRQPTPGSSLTWGLDLFDTQPGLGHEEFLFIDGIASQAADGYISQTATLSGADGRPLALSRQMFVVFG